MLSRVTDEACLIIAFERNDDVKRPTTCYLGPLSVDQQARLVNKQRRQISKRLSRMIRKKKRGLRFTFPISYPCPTEPTTDSSFSSVSSRMSSVDSLSPRRVNNSNLSHGISGRASPVSISFVDEPAERISNGGRSSSHLTIPSARAAAQRMRSSNAHVQKHSCASCGSALSHGICSCIVRNLIELNDARFSRSMRPDVDK